MLMKRNVAAGLTALAMLLPAATAALASPASEAQQLVTRAEMTVDNFKKGEKAASFRGLLAKSRGIVIVPELLRGGIGIGGEGGKAIVLVKDKKSGQWSHPAFFKIGGASFGPQLGFESSQIAVTLMNDETLDALLKGEVAVGGEAAASAGRKSAGVRSMATAETGDHAMHYFVVSKGAYVGATLKGSKIAVDHELNKGFYGKPVSVEQILDGKKIENAKADPLRRTLKTGTRQGSLSDKLNLKIK